jgi:lipopolysaccharide transport system permease protein
MKEDISAGMETVIEPSGKWVRLNLRDLLQYRDLLVLFVRRDFVARYKQTILGPLWFILQPLLTTLVFTLVFKQMAGLSTDGYPGLLFYLSGMLAWQYFAQCMNGTATTFLSHAGLFGKVYFPRMIVPLSVIISNLLAFALTLGTFVCFWVYFKYFTWAHDIIHPRWSLIFLPLVILQTAALGLGVGLWMSALTAKYRDFAHLSGFLTQLWMFGTLPLFMSISQIPERYQWVLAVNPVCPIVMWYRYAFLGSGEINLAHTAVSAGVTALLLTTGVLVFSRTERNFIDTV